jgi:signal transduction histidine kinase
VNRLPIRLRLTLAFGIVMAVGLAAIGVFVYLRVGGALLSSVDQTLRSQATEAVTNVRRGEPRLTDRDVAGGTTLAQLLAPDGHVVRSSPIGLAPLLRAPLPRAGESYRSISLRAPEGDWRLLAVRTGGVTGVVVVARSLEPREETLSRLMRELLVAAPLALLLACAAGYALASAALRPVEAMRRRASSVTASSPARLPVPRSGDEISRLAETLNEMLDRLHASLDHERRFVADASHELRTPLALLRTELDLALRRPRTAEELEAALRSAAEETQRLTRLAEDLLLIARGDRGALPLRRKHVAADGILEVVAERFARRAESAGVVVQVEASDLWVDADPERLVQALGNLLDNAIAYGGRSVTLSARSDAGAVELHIVDDGPGFPDAFIERAFDRFSRGDDARSSAGTGLGLSIVALIGAAHGGSAAVANRREGGADAWIAVPAVRRPDARLPGRVPVDASVEGRRRRDQTGARRRVRLGARPTLPDQVQEGAVGEVDVLPDGAAAGDAIGPGARDRRNGEG